MPLSVRRLAPFAAAVAVLLAASPAAAQSRAPGRIPIGGAIRLGIDSPSGSTYAGQPLRDEFGRQVSLTGELGIAVTPQLLLGGYLGGGIGDPGPIFDDRCLGSSRCGAWSGRIGLMAQFDFAPWSNVSPWIGYGVGFSAAGASGDEPGARFDYSYAGIDLARLSAGIDFRPNNRVGVGFFAEWTFGVYRAYRWREADVTVADGTLRDQTVHQWFSIGPRISF